MKRLWDVDELTERWSLSFEELAQLKGKSTINHLGFVAQLKYFQITGTFPQRRADLPEVPLSYLADQLDVALGDLHSYDWHGRTGKRHRAEILRFLQIRKATEEDYRQFTQWLVDDLLPADPDVARVQAEASLWFFQHVVAPAKPDTTSFR